MNRRNDLMTVGELASRTGLSIKAIREFEGRGLIYTAGRSASNYRLFDDSALWCVQAIQSLRSLGLTIKEIEQLAGVYLGEPRQPIGPHLETLLDTVERRISDRMEELELVRNRIRGFREQYRAQLAGQGEMDQALTTRDPHRRRT